MHICLRVVALATLATPLVAQATFTQVPEIKILPGASSDGVWHASAGSTGQAWVWSATSGAVPVATPDLTGTVGISPDGRTIGGTWMDDGLERAVLVNDGGTAVLGDIGGQGGPWATTFAAMNDSARVVVGTGEVDLGIEHAFKWAADGGMQDLGALDARASSRALGVSQDGVVVVGGDRSGADFFRPAYWVGTTEVLIADGIGDAYGTNSDGSVIVGRLENELFRWDSAQGLSTLGKLPDSAPTDYAIGFDVSDDGSTIVGLSGDLFYGTPWRAFVWRRGAGMVELEELLVALGAADADGADLTFASHVSADGRTISGVGGSPSQGFVATLPEVAEVYCTAKVNSAGCTPAIAFDGTPSASNGEGFVVSVAQVMASSTGLLIYGTTGPAAIPFQGGLLCVGGQVTRTASQDSGGSTGCTGGLSLDFNQHVAASGDPALVGGQTVWAQWWSRDPGFAPPNDSSTSDALEFTLWP